MTDFGQVFVPLLLEKDKVLMKLLFCSDILSITDWNYTKSVGIKYQVFLAGLCSYIFLIMQTYVAYFYQFKSILLGKIRKYSLG